MNRGSAQGSGQVQAEDRSFNEAPIHESGKSGAVSYDYRMVPRFNEAPIHESGKSWSRLYRPHESRGFNEAPIHESGKYESCRPS